MNWRINNSHVDGNEVSFREKESINGIDNDPSGTNGLLKDTFSYIFIVGWRCYYEERSPIFHSTHYNKLSPNSSEGREALGIIKRAFEMFR